jgi:hypothetical protein
MQFTIKIISALALASSVLAADPVLLSNGKDLSNWEVKGATDKNKWKISYVEMWREHPDQLVQVGPGFGTSEPIPMANLAAKHGDSLDIFSKQKFGSCRIELDVMVPKGSNSGIYVMGEYEVQVFDSFGKPDDKLAPVDMGAIYGAAVPKTNACKAPGEWQHYLIEWQAPKFDAQGNKTVNGKFIKVELNGKVLHENLEMKGPTPGGVTGQEHAEGPVMFQGNHGAVAFKNVKVTPL